MNEYHDMGNTLVGIGSYTFTLKNLDLDLNNRVTPLARPSI